MINSRHRRSSTLNPAHHDVSSSINTTNSSVTSTTPSRSPVLRQPTVVYTACSPSPVSRASSWSPDRMFWGPAGGEDRVHEGGRRAVWWSDGALPDKDTTPEKTSIDPGEIWARYTQTVRPHYTFEEPSSRKKWRSGGRRNGAADDADSRYTMKLSLPCPQGCSICVYSRHLGPVKVYFSNMKSPKKSSSPGRRNARRTTKVSKHQEPQLPLRRDDASHCPAPDDTKLAKNPRPLHFLSEKGHVQAKPECCRHGNASCGLCVALSGSWSKRKWGEKTSSGQRQLSIDASAHHKAGRATSPMSHRGDWLAGPTGPPVAKPLLAASSFRLPRERSLSPPSRLLPRRELSGGALPDMTSAPCRQKAKMAVPASDKKSSVTVS